MKIVPFTSESLVFPLLIYKRKNENVQNLDFTCFLYWCEIWSATL